MKRIKNTFSKSFFKASVIVALFAMALMIVPTNNVQTAHASLQDELNTLQNQISDTNKNIETKKNEATSLANDVAIFDEQLRQTELKIQETETEIKITAEKITQTEEDLRIKKETLNEYLRVIYEESNTSPLELVASSNSFSDFVDRSEYLQIMQIKIKDMVGRIKQMRDDLEIKKKDLNKLNDQLGSQRSDLNSKRITKAGLLNLTQEQQAELEKMAKGLVAKRGVFYCQIYGGCDGDINGSLVVVNRPPHYYQQSYTTPSWIPSFGCLVTSYAMVRTMLGNLTTPSEEVGYHGFDGDGNMTSSGDFGGKPERVLGTNWNSINMALDSGKPVIVGLRMDSQFYWSHFVVLVGRSGDTYYVNDPAFSAGRTYASSRVFKAMSY